MYGGLTVARSTYAHSGYSLYYQARTYVEPLVLAHTGEKSLTKKLYDSILLAPNYGALIRHEYLEKIVLAELALGRSLTRLYREVINLQEIYQPKVRHVFTEVIKLLDGRSRLPDLLSGIGSTMYASALYAYSDLAPVYLNRFRLKVSKGFVEKIVLEDTIISVFGYWRTFVEAIAFADHKFRKVSKTLLDSIALDDIRLADIEKTLADKIAFVDFKLYRMEKTLAEVIAFLDIKTFKISKAFAEIVIIGETFFTTTRRLFRDAIEFGDKIRRKLNGFYLTWSKAARAVADWTKRDRPESDWSKRDRPTRFT